MVQPDRAAFQPHSVPPLLKHKRSGEQYHRTAPVLAAIGMLSLLSPDELLERAQVSDTDQPDYVPSECLLFFVRRPLEMDVNTLKDLFIILRNRVLRSVPMPSRGDAERIFDVEVRDRVLDAFQELLCRDRKEYDDRLDYYEVNFNDALLKVRMTARRAVSRERKRFSDLPVEDTDGNPPPGAETWLGTVCSDLDDEEERLRYRSRLYAAISQLPPDEKRVIDLLLEGYLIESQDASVKTITKILGCSEKTVRNRRDRAIETLRAAMEEEDT